MISSVEKYSDLTIAANAQKVGCAIFFSIITRTFFMTTITG